MGHDLVERFAEELQNLSPFERRAALSELEALLHTNGIEASLRRRSTTALVIGAVLAVVVVRVVANRATFGGISAPTTGVSCSRWIERPPLGPVAADRAGGFLEHFRFPALPLRRPGKDGDQIAQQGVCDARHEHCTFLWSRRVRFALRQRSRTTESPFHVQC